MDVEDQISLVSTQKWQILHHGFTNMCLQSCNLRTVLLEKNLSWISSLKIVFGKTVQWWNFFACLTADSVFDSGVHLWKRRMSFCQTLVKEEETDLVVVVLSRGLEAQKEVQ